jgi:Porin subfamily
MIIAHEVAPLQRRAERRAGLTQFSLHKLGLCATVAIFTIISTVGNADELSDLRAEMKAMRLASAAMEKRLYRLEHERQRAREIARAETGQGWSGPGPVPQVRAVGLEPLNSHGVPLSPQVNESRLFPVIPGYMSIPGTNTSIKIGGLIKIDGMDDVHGGGMGGTSTDPRAIALIGTPASNRDGDFQATARQTMINIATLTPTKFGDLKTYVSMDFLGGTNGNQYFTNSYAPRLKEAYVSMKTSGDDTWLVGQTWSTFMDLTSYPETLDNGGPVGVVYIRQPQIRYTRNLGDGNRLYFAIESPFGDFEGNSAYPVFTNGGAPSTNILDPVPDFVVKLSHDANWGHVQIAGVARYIEDNTGGAVVSNFKGQAGTFGGGGMIGVTLKTWGLDTIKAQGVGGDGVGRYLYGDADTRASGASLGYCPGMTLACRIDPVVGYGGTIGYQHFWNPQLRSNFVGGVAFYPDEIPDSPTTSTKDVATAFANLIYSPLPNLDLGAEFIYEQLALQKSPQAGVASFGEAERLMFSLMLKL